MVEHAGGGPEFSGAVLTGGASTRMGRDKAFIEVGGVALGSVVASALRGAGAVEVVAVGGDVDRLGALGGFDAVVPDRWPGEGPLGGILTALESCRSDLVVVLACDTPTVSAACATALLGSLGPNDVAVGSVDGRRQPLTALWRRSACFEVLRSAFDAGERAPRNVLASLRVVDVELDPCEVADVDRPEDLSRYARGAVRRPTQRRR